MGLQQEFRFQNERDPIHICSTPDELCDTGERALPLWASESPGNR